MLKVLVIDDEPIALERIAAMPIWKESGFSLAATAGNGVEALELIGTLRPDIIITDIEMPGLDGLEFIRRLRENGDSTPVIILSCHESFDYARQAMLLGVDDYLIKDFLEQEVLRAALERVRKMKSRFEPIRVTPMVRAGSREPELTRLAETLVSGKCTPEEADAMWTAIRGSEDGILLFHLHFDCAERLQPIQGELERILRLGIGVSTDISRCAIDTVILLPRGSNDYFVILTWPAPGPNENLEDPVSFLQELTAQMRGRFSQSVTISWDSSLRGISELRENADRVAEMARFRPYLGTSRLILREHIKAIRYIDSAALERAIAELYQMARNNEREQIIRSMKSLYQKYLPGMLQYNYVQYLNSHLITILMHCIEHGPYSVRSLFGRENLPFDHLSRLETTAEICRWFEDSFSRLTELSEEHDIPVVTNRRVRLALETIHREYRDAGLNLDTIAGKAGVHKVYLSRVFRDETGATCHEYLQGLRIARSETMLGEGECRMYEIAEKCGFHNYDQFSLSFKKHKGMSPGEFRKCIQHKYQAEKT